MPKKSKKEAAHADGQIGTSEEAARNLALDSATIHKRATELVGQMEEAESQISRVREVAERFHRATGEIEESIHDLEIENRPDTAEREEGSFLRAHRSATANAGFGKEAGARQSLPPCGQNRIPPLPLDRDRANLLARVRRRVGAYDKNWLYLCSG
jgi:hypothetical protein